MIDKIKEKLIADRNYFNPANNDFQNGRNYEAQRILDFIDELEQKLNLSGIVRPDSASAQGGEPLPAEGKAQSVCVDGGEHDYEIEHLHGGWCSKCNKLIDLRA